MNGDSKSVVTYSNGGSPLNCTVSFVVQSFNINGVQRILPTLGAFTETKNLSPQTTVAIFSTATECMYTGRQIIAKTNYVMVMLCNGKDYVIILVLLRWYTRKWKVNVFQAP